MNKQKARILVVDDEPRYVWAIKLNLEARGYEVLVAQNGEAAIGRTVNDDPDVIVLDVRMPGLNGYEVCAQIREFSTVPIIMLTALAEEGDKVKGLDAGADDYVTKPFGAEELLARVRAAVRRREQSGRAEASPVLRTGELQVDLTRQRVFVRDMEIILTPVEFRLLQELAKQAGRVLVPEYLLEKVWGVGYEGEQRLLRQAIHRLRQKIEGDPGHPRYIHTLRGIGYTLSEGA